MSSTVEAVSDNNRCRVKMTMNSKGLYQLEATAEFDDPATAAQALFDTLGNAKDLAEANGYPLVKALTT